MAFTEEDLRGLSAVERETMLAMGDDDEDVALATGVSPDDGDDGDDDGDDAPAPKAPAADDAPAGDEPPAPAAGDESEDDEPAAVTPRATPQDAGEQRAALRAEQAAALQKLMDGEIDPEAYNKLNNETQDKLEALVRAEAADQTRDMITRDAMMKDYSAELGAVQKAVRAAGLDLKDEATGAEFDRAVRMFANEATARGLADVPGNLAASRAALSDAQEYLLRRHGKSAPAPAAAPAPVATKSPARVPQAPDRSQLPPTLANIPAAADATISNEFSHLENLEGNALERALARLTPDQQDRYLA